MRRSSASRPVRRTKWGQIMGGRVVKQEPPRRVCVGCGHSEQWHGSSACGYPGCSCSVDPVIGLRWMNLERPR